jgi:hypothetical protein
VSQLVGDQYTTASYPEKEQRDDQTQRNDELLSLEIATLYGSCVHWNTAACHADRDPTGIVVAAVDWKSDTRAKSSLYGLVRVGEVLHSLIR